jgi:hypothetical protein
VFATAAQGRNVLTQRDDFVQRMSPFDRAARLKADQDVTEQTYLDFVSAQVREWSDDDKAAVQATLSDLRPRVNALGEPWPDPIFLVKTTGNEEGSAGLAHIFSAARVFGTVGDDHFSVQSLRACTGF